MILTKKEILREIKKKRIKIIPFDIESLGPASLDLTLDNKIRIFENIDHTIDIFENTDYSKITKKKIIKDKYIIKPGELVLGITKEKITLPEDICGWLSSRSRFSRLGLMVHITAPFVQPGVFNKQVLEIYNAGPNNLGLIPGTKICQFIFERCEGKAKYTGKFKDQKL